MIGKAEVNARGQDVRFVVTNLPAPGFGPEAEGGRFEPQRLYEECYCARGEMENVLKQQVLDLKADRLSTHYLRTGSVALCVLAHAFVNVSVIVLSALPWHIPGMTGNDLSKVEFQAWWLTLSGLAMVLAGIWGFRKVTPCTDSEDTPAPPVIKPSEEVAPRKDLAGLGP